MHRKDLLNEHIYNQERAGEFMRSWAKILGLSRRQFLHLLATGAGAAASVNFLASGRQAGAVEAAQAILKAAPPELFVRSGSNVEMRWEAMYHRGYLVPNELFFVRNNSPAVPRPDPATWRLQVEGSGVSCPRSFSHDEILAMPSISVICALECALCTLHLRLE